MEKSHRTAEGREEGEGEEEREGHPTSFEDWEPRVALTGLVGTSQLR